VPSLGRTDFAVFAERIALSAPRLSLYASDVPRAKCLGVHRRSKGTTALCGSRATHSHLSLQVVRPGTALLAGARDVSHEPLPPARVWPRK